MKSKLYSLSYFKIKPLLMVICEEALRLLGGKNAESINLKYAFLF